MKQRMIRNKKTRYASLTALLTALVVAVTVLANAVFDTLATRYAWYTDLVGETTFDVTDACYGLLEDSFASMHAEGNDGEVEIILCDLEKVWQAEYTQQLVYHTAKSIAERFPERIRLTFHDIFTNPGSVRAYAEKTDPLTGETQEIAIKSTSVIVVAEGYHRVYSLEEFYVFEGGDTSQLWAYDGEKTLASAILHAADPDEHIACVLKNHGEAFHDYELLYLLDDAGYTIHYMDLYTDEIPDGCNLIVSYNPTSDLIADGQSDISETDILDAFLAKGGNSLWVFLDNGTPHLPNFERYLGEWGVGFSYYRDVTTDKSFRYMVQDASQSLTSDGYTIYAERAEGAYASALLDGMDRRIVFKNATAIEAAQGFLKNSEGDYVNGTRTMHPIYRASEKAISWANGKPVSGDEAFLMALSEDHASEESSYVGVIASVDFSAESFLQSAVYGNGDLMKRMLKTVGKDYVPEGLTIKPFSSTEISTVTTAQILRWTLTLVLIPAVTVTAVAVTVLVRRRRA